jgi:cell pole-organizing protein PopZ
MNDGRGANNDPSMDDILASIRKIISDDEARAQVSGGAATPAAANAPGSASRHDDVLLLTDLVEEPVEEVARAPEPTPLPQRIDPVSASEMPQPTVPPVELPIDPPVASIEPTPVLFIPVAPVEAPVKQPIDTLIEPGAAGVAASAFDRLSQAVQESVPTPAAHDPGPAVGGRNLEDIVKDMLRPMLKEWLDKNLPPMVERYVEREIVRLTRR